MMEWQMRFKQFMEDAQQRPFDFNVNDVKQLWREINRVSFGGKLHEPPIYVEPTLNHLLNPAQAQQMADEFGSGEILGYCDEDPETGEVVLLFNADMRTASELMDVVAHEMVHQALAQEYGYVGMLKAGHGPKFMAYAPAIAKYHGVKLLDASY
jgi:hypothetical protein